MVTVSAEPTQKHEFGLGDTTLTLFEADDGQHRQFTSIWRIPEGIANYHAPSVLWQSHANSPENTVDLSLVHDLTRFAQPHSYETFKGGVRRQPFLRYLGYHASTRTRPDARGRRVVTGRFTYPTVDTLNGFMDDVFGEDGGVRFEGYERGAFTPAEFVEALVKSGKVLLADIPPYSAHDFSDHAIGWMGLDPKAFQALRKGAGACLKHITPELDRPPVNPDIFTETAETGDEISGNLGAHALLSNSDWGWAPKLSDIYSSFWSFTNGEVRSALIHAGLQQAQVPYIHGSAHDSSATTRARYERANEYAVERSTA